MNTVVQNLPSNDAQSVRHTKEHGFLLTEARKATLTVSSYSSRATNTAPRFTLCHRELTSHSNLIHVLRRDGFSGHDIAEEVTLTVVQLCEEEVIEEDEEVPDLDPEGETITVTVRQTQVPVSACMFLYEYDSTFYLTKFLTSSVYNDHALDNLELIKSDRFDLSNEVLSTLDVRLSRALRNANLTSGDWHILGGDSIHDAHCEERESLLHLCARLGLCRVAAYLLERPGSEDALRLPNRHGDLPSALAAQYGFHDLAEMLSGVPCPNDFDYSVDLVHPASVD
ncbi:hypothetical protein RRG08_022626 [Elysia crispata]|uniref:Uncharacterized protein n=1 Tax=Elysia crispata TaxID=231223 RepID=A0AAE0Z2S6_9GAST|nr:hypothetical protein RRG08_022626 [Elysia crispata]